MQHGATYTRSVGETDSHVRVLEDLQAQRLRRPYAVVGFGGWIDASTAATGAVHYLVEQLGAHRVAELDPEAFYTFTDTRPHVSTGGVGRRELEWPRAEWFVVRQPDDIAHDLILFVAPEPNLRWRTFTEVVLDVLQQLGAETVVSLGAVLASVHHRAQVPLRGWSAASHLRDALRRGQIGFSDYQGPAGIATVLLAAAQERGLPAVGLSALSPSYIAGMPNPRTSAALLRAVTNLSAIPLPLTNLERAGRVLQERVDHSLAEQPDLREQVDRLAPLTDLAEPAPAEEAGHDETAHGELPSSAAVLRELEDFLNQLRGDTGGAPGGT